MHHKRSVMI